MNTSPLPPYIAVYPADAAGCAWAQAQVQQHHYLRARVDTRCSPLAYIVRLIAPKIDRRVGCLIFGRPEATRCYDGDLTYGSIEDVRSGRAEFSRWEVLNLARVWLDSCVQVPGQLYYHPFYLPGFIDRHHVFRSTLASYAIDKAIQDVVFHYLLVRPPCFLEEPYQIRRIISYCDTRKHKGTIYGAAGFSRARTNADGIETWACETPPLDDLADRIVREAAERSPRSRQYRAARLAEQITQQELGL